jgi:hypothetical protein
MHWLTSQMLAQGTPSSTFQVVCITVPAQLFSQIHNVDMNKYA